MYIKSNISHLDSEFKHINVSSKALSFIVQL